MANEIKPSGNTMSLGNIYLLFYNLLQFLGWTMILVQTISHVCYHGLQVSGLYKETKICVMIFQTAAWLEVLHIVLGLVRSSVATTAVQIFSRNFLVWAILFGFDAPKLSYGLLPMLTAWSVTEVIRYSFYFMNLLNQSPFFLVFLRYTLFIGLYPLGVFGELLCTYSALAEIRCTGAYSIELPNRGNITFNFYYMCILTMLSYIPFFPQLYLYMISQRKKVLGTNVSKKRE